MRADNHVPTLMAYREADKNCWAGQSAHWFLETQKNAGFRTEVNAVCTVRESRIENNNHRTGGSQPNNQVRDPPMSS
jgi:hypothetical protein